VPTTKPDTDAPDPSAPTRPSRARPTGRLHRRPVATSLAYGVALLALGAAASACGSSSSSSAAKLPAGLTAFGYSHVAASQIVPPSSAVTLHGGDVTMAVPAGAISTKARVELLEGSTTYWQQYAPTGQKVVAAFAFRVVDTATNQLITKFPEPIVVKVSAPGVVASSEYLDSTPSNPPRVVPNPIAPKINGTTLAHGNLADAVGWLVTSPAG
jgi:hypothetical protein